MADKVVIRLINPRPQDRDEHFAPAPVVVYYWRRIAAALVLGAVLLYGLYVGVRALLSPSESEVSPPAAAAVAKPEPGAPKAPSSANVTASAAKSEAPPIPAGTPEAKPKLTAEAPATEQPAVQPKPGAPSRVAIQSRNIRRAQLTSNVVKDEPVDRLPRVIQMNEQGLVKVYLHTELSGLKGRVLFHDWYWKDKLIARVRVPVREDKQISATSKFIDRIMTGPWKVKVVDQQKKLYAQASFEIR